MKKPLLITICGESGTGKSTLGKTLVEKLDPTKTTRIPTDYYFLTNTYGNMLDYYQDDRTDWKLLEKHLKNPIGTKIYMPQYDFENLERVSEIGEKFFILNEINIIDGLYPYQKADFIIHMDIDPKLRKERILRRHINERQGRDKVAVEFMLSNWDHIPSLKQWLLKHKVKVDLVIDANRSCEDNAIYIKQFISSIS